MSPFQIEDGTLDSFGEFMYKQNKFKLGRDYDIAVLIGTDRNFVKGTGI